MKKKIMVGLIAIAAIIVIVIFSGCIAPTAKVSAIPTRTNIGESVSFSGVDSIDPDGTITSYEWDFDDGTTASDATVAHSYSLPGTYNVKLTVTDNDGLSSTVQLPVKVVLGTTIQIKVNATTWRAGKEPFEWGDYYSEGKLYRAIERKLEDAGFEAISNERGVADTMLIVDYKEEKGSWYIGEGGEGGYGTDIKCTLKLRDRNNNIVFEKELTASMPVDVYYTTYSGIEKDNKEIEELLYWRALERFRSNVYFEHCGEIIASKYLFDDELSLIIPKLKDYFSSDRANAAEALGELGNTTAVGPLLDLVNDESSRVRESVARALGRLGDPRAVEPLTAMLEDESAGVRRAAQEALKKI